MYSIHHVGPKLLVETSNVAAASILPKIDNAQSTVRMRVVEGTIRKFLTYKSPRRGIEKFSKPHHQSYSQNRGVARVPLAPDIDIYSYP